MANTKKRCKFCREYFTAADMIKVPAGTFCTIEHALQFSNKKNEKAARRQHTAAKKKDKARLRELRTRSSWYADLQVLVNQYVRYRDRNEPCCTCGTTNPDIKYDAGHFHTKAARPDIRFELTNIHRQCSQKCNVYGSGMRNEYEKFIKEKYGQKHLDWLTMVQPSLKEQFPNWQDIEAEIIRYRKLLREHGLKPRI